jgi:DnaK suppressor protein
MAETAHLELRVQLDAEHQRVIEQLADLGHDGSREQFDENFADSGQVTAERGEVEAIVATLLESRHDIEHALEKFDTGRYGVCEQCGNAISPARLEAMPTARLCITCASKRR